MLKFNINECLNMFYNGNSKNIIQNTKNNNKYKIIEYNFDETSLKQTNLFDENILETLF